MEKLDVQFYIKDARQKLAGRDAHRLAALHTGVTVAAALLITLLQFALSAGIGKTGGLSGLGTRSMLETLQTVLQWVNMVLMPFWSLGFVYAAMQWAEGHAALKEDLLTGFRRFGPYLRLLVIRGLLVMVALIVCCNLASMLYLMMPASSVLTDLAMRSGGDINVLSGLLTQMSAEQLATLQSAMIPALVICGILAAVLLLPLLYRFRLAEYAILNRPGTGALAAMRISAVLMRRRCLQFLRLDLRLWWYYGLKVLCLVICYADLLLEAVGISLPGTENGAAFLVYLIYLAVLFAVETLFRPQVETAYAGAYRDLMERGAAPGKTPTLPKNVPWDEP